MKRMIAAALAASALVVAPTRALEPPRQGELATLKRSDAARKRLEHAIRLGNHQIDRELLDRALNRGKRALLQKKGGSPSDLERLAPLYAPPPGWRGMPTTGAVKIPALLVEFQDNTHAASNTRDFIHANLFGAGDPASFPIDSLKNYYARASYDKLDLSGGTTLGWYQTGRPRPVDTDDANAAKVPGDLIKEVIRHYDAQGHDFSQYDADGNGVIDYFVVIWTGPPGPWASLWWGWQSNFEYHDPNFTIDGKKLGKFSWQWEASPPGTVFTPRVVIHETGHALGLPDLYDYDPSVGEPGGVGGLDMMDANWGDHNCFSKWVLDWLVPTYVTSGTHLLHLAPTGTSESCVLAWPGLASGSPFNEFFVAQNRQRVANDTGLPADGMLIWHIDATLDSTGRNYAFNNSVTDHKLVRLMEADGLEQIAQLLWANASDYWTGARYFGPHSIPSSKQYDGASSGVLVYGFSAPGPDMAATFEISSEAAGGGWVDDGSAVRLMNEADAVGIGTSTPAGKLHVDVDGDGGADLLVLGSGAGKGNVGIGTRSPAGKLHVDADGSGGADLFVPASGTAKGFLGLGTSRPRYRLTVGDSATTEAHNYLEINAAQWTGVLLHGGGRGAQMTYHHPSNYLSLGTSPGDGTGPWERLGISGGGVLYLTPQNLHTVHPGLRGSQLAVGWNVSGGRGETDFYQHGGAGWRSGYDFWSERNGVAKKLLVRFEDTGDVKVLGSVGSLSDGREKTEIGLIDAALEKVLALRGVHFRWKEGAGRDADTHLGLVAQEVRDVVPEVVDGGSGGEPYTLQYDGLIPVLLEAIKEQQRMIRHLSSRVEELERSSGQAGSR